MNGLIDTHAHLTEEVFFECADEVLRRSSEQGIESIIVPGYTFGACRRAVELAGSHSRIFAAVGLHPLYLTPANDSTDALGTEDPITDLTSMIDSPGVIAVGEIGLDYRHTSADRPMQRTAFIRQLEIAREWQLPVIIHAVRADSDLLDILKSFGRIRGIIHRVSCSRETARQLIEMDFCFSIGPDLFIPGRTRLQELVRMLPLDRMLLETDCPFSRNAAGEVSQPSDIRGVLDEIARLRNEDSMNLALLMHSTAHSLFHFLKDSPTEKQSV